MQKKKLRNRTIWIWRWQADAYRFQRPKAPADVVGNAVRVMQIATGEVEEKYEAKKPYSAAAELRRLGGKSRAKKLTSEQRSETARKAAITRWVRRERLPASNWDRFQFDA